jgi:DNA polymerase-3 subunit gamma/tau
MAASPQADALPRPQSFRDVAQLAESRREAMLHAHLLHDVHLVRFAPGMIELRPEPTAPRDLAALLGKMLAEATGERWTIALSREEGQPTLARQGQAADTARRSAAAEHPLVRAILEAFPGASIDKVSDSRADVYGLAPELALGEPDMPEFAPPDAELAQEMED